MHLDIKNFGNLFDYDFRCFCKCDLLIPIFVDSDNSQNKGLCDWKEVEITMN